MTNADAEGVSSTSKDGAQPIEQAVTRHSGSTSAGIPANANQTKEEAAHSGQRSPSASELFLHHLFLLPAYIGILIGVGGAVVAVILLGWVCVLFWQRALYTVGAIIVAVWAVSAWDHFNSHGWRYTRPDELAKLDDEECDKKDPS